MDNKEKIFDVFLFFNELDLLEIRLKTLFEHVDYFVITEVYQTFSGKPKSLIFGKNIKKFKKYLDKIIYNPISENDLLNLKKKYWNNLTTNLNKSFKHKHNGKKGKFLHSSSKREISHRDSCIIGLEKYASLEDIILLSDLDEIPNPEVVSSIRDLDLNRPHYFQMSYFLYWINNKVEDDWFGTVAFKYSLLQGLSLDLMRYSSTDKIKVPGPIVKNGGWHFSYLGGIEKIHKKIEALGFQGYKLKIFLLLNYLGIRKFETSIENKKDIFGKNSELKIVEIDKSYPDAILEDKIFISRFSK